MTQRRVITVAVVVASYAGRLAGQSLLDRPPNLSGGWLGAPGTVQFNFVHRFSISTPPARKVSNSPTFFFSYRLPLPIMIGLNYATSSDVSPTAVNEFEGFARYARTGPLDVAAQLGYNQAAKSVDGEITLSRTFQRLRLIAVGRALSHAYGVDTARYAVGGGAVLRLTRWVAVAADAATLIDRRPGEKAAVGSGSPSGNPLHAAHRLAAGGEHEHGDARRRIARHRRQGARRVRVHDPVHVEPVLRKAKQDGGEGRRRGGSA